MMIKTNLVCNYGTARGSRICCDLSKAELASVFHITLKNGGREERTTTPLSYMHPTMVVPVLVAFGKGTPRACNAALRL